MSLVRAEMDWWKAGVIIQKIGDVRELGQFLIAR